ncbi:hypothetical protein C5167_007822 [Papaver somniferum]|nr:hypothetical protein C5167_007822 [Papaver somniferum]
MKKLKKKMVRVLQIEKHSGGWKQKKMLNSKEKLGFDVLSWKEAKEVVIFAAGEGINEISYNMKMEFKKKLGPGGAVQENAEAMSSGKKLQKWDLCVYVKLQELQRLSSDLEYTAAVAECLRIVQELQMVLVGLSCC